MLTERLMVSQTNNVPDKCKHCILTLQVTVGPKFKIKIKKKNLLHITLIRSQDPGLFPCSHNLVLLAEHWLSITSLGKRIH